MDNITYATIYKATDNTNGNVYYGSTTETVDERFQKHESVHKICDGCGLSICSIIRNRDYSVEIVERFPCEEKKVRLKREAYYITSFPCINKEVPGRTRKEYYEANKEYIQKRKREYQSKNPDKVKQWNENRKAKRLIDGKLQQWRKNDYLKHREERLQKSKAYLKRQPTLTCQCGKNIKRLYMKGHLKTKQHKLWQLNAHNIFNHL